MQVMVVVIDLKMFMKAKYHFHVEIQIRSQVYNLPEGLEGEGRGAFVYCMVKTGDGKYIYRKDR